MSVEVKLELGHRAVQREKKTVEGFTHDWTVFVRGADGNNAQYFVEKVVFHLHESFPKPKRVLKDPPYSVSESGYAGFIMPIDVYFRSREEPRKVTFKYDMYLRLEGLPVTNIRIEKLTFQNPSSEFRSKLIKAGGLAGALSGSAAGGSASLSTQACAPPQHVDEHHQPNPPKQAVAEKKQPRSHVPSKELPSKPTPPPPPKPSQPFTDIFGAPIRTKSSPDSSTVKSKDSGHSSQPKSKAPPSSSSSSSSKEGKPSAKDKESHKSKDSHHSKDKDSHPPKESKETAHSSKDPHPPKETIHPLKEVPPKEPHPPSTKDSSQSSKDCHHTPKEKHPPKEHHSKEGHKSKDSHHSSKEGKTPKESRPPEPKDSKPSKSIKPDKELSKSSGKRAAPTDSHSSHGNVEKKKKSSPISSESSDKSSSQPKHKSKEVKNKAEKHKNKSHSNSVKKEEEKPKHKRSPTSHHPPESKEPLKPKPNSPYKAPSPPLKPPSPPPKPPSPPPIVKPPSPIAVKLPSPIAIKPPSPIAKPPSPDSTSMDSDSDDSHKSSYNKAQYSSPASSISESSLHDSHPIPGLISDHSILSPLSDEDDSSPSVVRKRKLSSGDYDHGDVSPDFKSVENKPMPKLKKKQNSSHHKPSFKPKPSENFHRGNGSINNDIPMDRSPRLDFQNNYVNNLAYRQELMQLQQIIMSSNDPQLLQSIVDLIEKTGKYEVTNTTFDFDLCSLDPAIIQKIKLYLRSM